jgi:signal transduction histidine kinase
LEASERVAELVGNINIYMSTKEIPLNIETVRLREMLQMIRDEFSVELDTREIRWSQAESMPEIRADSLSMLRILRNLAENALKHGGEHLSEVKIGYEESDEFHILSVGNDGVPIKLKDPEKIFRPFERRGTSEGAEGTGLGLAIVKELAEQHGGKVRVKSGREKGVIFSIFISRHL